jgi:hypothetical protein
MYISWTRVTWYSQIIAIILFFAIFVVGIWLGTKVEAVKISSHAAVQGIRSDQPNVPPNHSIPAATYTCNGGNEIQATFTGTEVSIDMENAIATTTSLHCNQIAAPVSP